MASGSQPPSPTLSRLAPRKHTSTARKTDTTSPSFHGGQCQRRRATAAKSTVVMSIVPDTASPYAAASAWDERKLTTTTMHAVINTQLMAGR